MMSAISQFELVAIFLALTAPFSWVNFRLGLMLRIIGLLVTGLRQVEVLQGQGNSIAVAVRQICMTRQTYFRGPE